MSTLRTDPLLGLAKALLTFMLIVIVIGMVGLGIGFAAAVGLHGMVAEKLAKAGAAESIYWLILLMFPLLAAMLASMHRFVEKLRAIVTTVEDGDPFTPGNAERLRAMAWLSVIIQLLSIPVGIVGVMLEQASADAASVNVDADFSINGLLLALVLFILARVFRIGAQMREDLEGTV
ncbi:DUF2975 domain-containing protein [Novosphingobium sp. ES2-1]|uniref:DUF2975 domain-containing protein n=1 Tax=Novosphingobium sp. ES2-1 TaxID=2780074 RepID=UPI0018816C7C|nr:DUF2975 domain-containing protein [Novosphingobium sp. ES2-1]QOV93812.1 DUF2975 domain-containing protein [Novosphingobium sp. ES2-1]